MCLEVIVLFINRGLFFDKVHGNLLKVSVIHFRSSPCTCDYVIDRRTSLEISCLVSMDSSL